MTHPLHRLPQAAWERLTGLRFVAAHHPAPGTIKATPGGLDTATIDARFAACAACDKYVPPLFGKAALCYAKQGCKKLHPPARAATCPLGKWAAVPPTL